MLTDKQLVRFRKKYGLSREAVADLVGVSAQTVWRWEKGERIPPPAARLLTGIIESRQRPQEPASAPGQGKVAQ